MDIRPFLAGDAPALLMLWRGAVLATHHFLSQRDFAQIEAEVADYLPQAAPWVAVDEAGAPLGFLCLSGGHIDALFVHRDAHRRGVGRALIAHAAALAGPALTVDVNAQNPGAVAFYTRMGFVETGRSPVDDAGRPYPLLHMRR